MVCRTSYTVAFLVINLVLIAFISSTESMVMPRSRIFFAFYTPTVNSVDTVCSAFPLNTCFAMFVWSKIERAHFACSIPSLYLPKVTFDRCATLAEINRFNIQVWDVENSPHINSPSLQYVTILICVIKARAIFRLWRRLARTFVFSFGTLLVKALMQLKHIGF